MFVVSLKYVIPAGKQKRISFFSCRKILSKLNLKMSSKEVRSLLYILDLLFVFKFATEDDFYLMEIILYSEKKHKTFRNCLYVALFTHKNCTLQAVCLK